MRRSPRAILIGLVLFVSGCAGVSQAADEPPRPVRKLEASETAASGSVLEAGKANQGKTVRELKLVEAPKKPGLTRDGCILYYRPQEAAPVTGEGFYYDSPRVCFRQLAMSPGVFVAVPVNEGVTDQREDQVDEAVNLDTKPAYFIGLESADEALRLYDPVADKLLSVLVGATLPSSGHDLASMTVWLNGKALSGNNPAYPPEEARRMMYDFVYYAKPWY